MAKRYEITAFGETDEVYLVKKTYPNGRLAVLLDSDEGPYAVLTVNIPGAYCPEGCAYLDTNNFPQGEDFVVKNGLAEDMEEIAFSGYCMYPLYRFDIKKLEE